MWRAYLLELLQRAANCALNLPPDRVYRLRDPYLLSLPAAGFRHWFHVGTGSRAPEVDHLPGKERCIRLDLARQTSAYPLETEQVGFTPVDLFFNR